MGYTRDSARYALAAGRKQLEALGIELPGEVIAAFGEYDRVVAETPAPAGVDDLHDAILAGAGADAINGQLLADIGADKLRLAYTRATITAAARAMGAIFDAHDVIFEQVRDRAGKLIEQIERAAAITEPLSELVRAGRHDDAQVLVNLEVTAAALEALYDLRNVYLADNEGVRVGWHDASVWSDPTAEAGHRVATDSPGERLVRGVRAGATLWFPSQAEALAAAEQLNAEAERERRELAAAQRAQGNVYGYVGG